VSTSRGTSPLGLSALARRREQAVRTPVGKRGGALAAMHSADLAPTPSRH
jgi:hypothetical protein